jgi:hypothetical protein
LGDCHFAKAVMTPSNAGNRDDCDDPHGHTRKRDIRHTSLI